MSLHDPRANATPTQLRLHEERMAALKRLQKPNGAAAKAEIEALRAELARLTERVAVLESRNNDTRGGMWAYMRGFCNREGVSAEEIQGNYRGRHITEARHRLIMELTAAFPHASSEQIARVVGREGSSVRHAIRKGRK